MTIASTDKTDGGALIAIKNSFISERVISEQPDSSLVCKIQLAENEIFICAFYNPPRTSPYRYEVNDFQKLLKIIPKSKTTILCGDINCPDVNWKTLASTNGEENEVMNCLRNPYTDKS